MIISTKVLFIFGWFLLIFFVERVSQKFYVPSALKDNGISRWSKNLTFGLVNRLLLPLLTFPIIFFAASHPFFQRPTELSGIILLFIDILILDLASYFFHRLSHSIPLLWRLHEIHHLDSAFDVTTGLRIHFGELILANIFRALPIVLFAIPLKSVIIFEFILVLEGLFHHSNIVIPQGINKLLRYFIIMPDQHAVHHHAFQPDSDSNYGFIFVWWDKLWGTFNTRHRTAQWTMGLEYSDDLSLSELMISPFRKIPLIKRSKHHA